MVLEKRNVSLSIDYVKVTPDKLAGIFSNIKVVFLRK